MASDQCGWQGGIHGLVLVDRGLDIGPAWYAGQPLAWMSSTGITHPWAWSSDAWLRTFYGGLVFTAGLQNVGAPNTDEGESHGIHGRIGNLPARNVTVETVEEDDRLVLLVRGEVRETTVYGVDLMLRRTLRFPVGEALVTIHDEIVNLGYAPAPLFVLYHVNPGYPVLDVGSRLVVPRAEVVGNDDASQAAVAQHAESPAPSPDFEAQVFEPTASSRAARGIARTAPSRSWHPAPQRCSMWGSGPRSEQASMR